jgi:hypothetical protein
MALATKDTVASEVAERNVQMASVRSRGWKGYEVAKV